LILAIGALRLAAVGVGLFVLIPSLMEWTGSFPELIETLNSGAPSPTVSATEQVLNVCVVVIVSSLLIVPYRAVKPWWLRAAFVVGLLFMGVWVGTSIPEAINGVRAGKEDPLIIPATVAIALIPLGNIGAFAMIATRRYRSIFSRGIETGPVGIQP
jgi:hypothetical protein